MWINHSKTEKYIQATESFSSQRKIVFSRTITELSQWTINCWKVDGTFSLCA